MEYTFASISESRKLVGTVALFLLLTWETALPFFAFFRARHGARLLHAARNLLISGLNGALASLLFIGTWQTTAEWTARHKLGIFNLASLPAGLRAVGMILVFDAWTYGWHRANHRIPFLWRFHRMHHTDAEMDVTSANRFHPGEIAISSLLRIPLLMALGATLRELALY